jgi:hypothetical protein
LLTHFRFKSGFSALLCLYCASQPVLVLEFPLAVFQNRVTSAASSGWGSACRRLISPQTGHRKWPILLHHFLFRRWLNASALATLRLIAAVSPSDASLQVLGSSPWRGAVVVPSSSADAVQVREARLLLSVHCHVTPCSLVVY